MRGALILGSPAPTPGVFGKRVQKVLKTKDGCYKECAKVQNVENTQLDAESELKIERSGFFGIFEYSDMILQTYVVVASPNIVGDRNKRALQNQKHEYSSSTGNWGLPSLSAFDL